jgi:CAAX prenyl protease-like protein
VVAANVPAFGPVRVPAFGPLNSAKVRTLGIVGAMFFAMIFVFLGTIVVTESNGDSPIFGGSWGSYTYPMIFYLFGMALAVGLIAYTKDLALLPKQGDVSRFLINYSLWTIITWGALTLIYPNGSGALPIPTGIDRYQTFIFTSLFVAPTEEILFRAVLPRVLNSWVLGSVIAFPIYHIPIEIKNYGSMGPVAVGEALAEIAILGVVLWYIYSYVLKIRLRGGKTIAVSSGLGGSVGFHAAYDNFVAAVLRTFPIALASI